LIDHSHLSSRGGAEPEYGVWKGTNNVFKKKKFNLGTRKLYIKKLHFLTRPQCTSE